MLSAVIFLIIEVLILKVHCLEFFLCLFHDSPSYYFKLINSFLSFVYAKIAKNESMLSTIQKTFVFLHQKAIFGDIKNN